MSVVLQCKDETIPAIDYQGSKGETMHLQEAYCAGQELKKCTNLES
jgi:hypothetical protein